jgi:DNA-binding LacI/PurR family transcriptional regulator
MADVAERAGVSRALVSLIFREEPGASAKTRDHVMAVARELGYEPNLAARMLAQSASRQVGVMMNLRNPFHGELADHLYPLANAQDLDLIISATNSTHPEQAAIEVLRGYRCAGYVLLGATLSSREIIRLSHVGPVVVVGNLSAAGKVDSVHYDDAAGINLALDHVRSLGHRRIAHIDGRAGVAMRRRAAAYRAWMARVLPEESVDVIPGHDTEAGGLEAAARLVERHDLPTAVVCANDRCAIGLMAGLDQAQVRVPEQVSVVGFDDIEYVKYGGLNLTTVRQDTALLAETAMAALSARLREPDRPAQSVVFAPELIVRGTVVAPRA